MLYNYYSPRQSVLPRVLARVTANPRRTGQGDDVKINKRTIPCLKSLRSIIVMRGSGHFFILAILVPSKQVLRGLPISITSSKATHVDQVFFKKKRAVCNHRPNTKPDRL